MDKKYNLFEYDGSLVFNDSIIEDRNYFSSILQKPKTSHKRNKVKNVESTNIQIVRQVWAFSSFYNVNFLNCSFEKVSFQNTKICKCGFYGINGEMNIVYFSSSHIEETEFVGINFCSVDFVNATFYGCHFKNVVFRSCNFPGATFINCTFDKIELTMSNIEYASFVNCSIINSQLNFNQIPYVIGGLELVESSENCILRYKRKEKIDGHQYINMLSLFIRHYLENSLHFPLANIYSFLHKKQLAKNEMIIGFKEALLEENEELLFFYSKLINHHNCLSIKERKALLNGLYSSYSTGNLKYLKNSSLKRIEEELLGTESTNSVRLVIQTNIDYKDAELTNSLRTIDAFLSNECKIGKFHQLSISHNSPAEIVVTIIGLISSVITIVDFINRHFSSDESVGNKKIKKITTITKKTDGSVKIKIKEYK